MSERSMLGRAYDRWMAFAGVLNRIASAIIFGGCYLVIAGALAGWQRLSRRRPAAAETFWRTRTRPTSGADFFRRMS